MLETALLLRLPGGCLARAACPACGVYCWAGAMCEGWSASPASCLCRVQGFKEKNRFGKLFEDAVTNGVPECEVESCLQGFDTNVLRITSGKFDDFVNWIVQNHPHDSI
jgi:hypothetical protein